MKFYRNIFLISTFSILLFACNSAPDKAPQGVNPAKTGAVNSAPAKGVFAHTVYFWLNQPQSPLANLAFKKSIKKFVLNSPDITTYHLGKAAATKRPVVDNTYTYALLLTFEDQAAHDRYQEDPAHKLFLKEAEALWSKVVVYDSENILN